MDDAAPRRFAAPFFDGRAAAVEAKSAIRVATCDATTRTEETCVTTRPRAADDFATIRSRLEELRRERDRTLADQKGHSVIGPRPYHLGATGHTEDHRDRMLPR